MKNLKYFAILIPSKKVSLWFFYTNLFNPEYIIINLLLNQVNLQKICIKGSFLETIKVYKKCVYY